jgi:hypothetical protein
MPARSRVAGILRSNAVDLPEWAEGLTLENVRALGATWTARVEDGAVAVEAADALVG